MRRRVRNLSKDMFFKERFEYRNVSYKCVFQYLRRHDYSSAFFCTVPIQGMQ
jgi:hypothetical protein